MTKKPDTKELNRKERKQVRRAMKSNFEQIQRSKKIWEELRRFLYSLSEFVKYVPFELTQ